MISPPPPPPPPPLSSNLRSVSTAAAAEASHVTATTHQEIHPSKIAVMHVMLISRVFLLKILTYCVRFETLEVYVSGIKKCAFL